MNPIAKKTRRNAYFEPKTVQFYVFFKLTVNFLKFFLFDNQVTKALFQTFHNMISYLSTDQVEDFEKTESIDSVEYSKTDCI